jgi:peptide/nickel transport system substrate-binding protein
MSHKKMSRRNFLRMSALGVAGVALASCAAPEPAVEPTMAPEVKPTEVQPTAIPTQAATATPVPTVAAAKEAPQLADMVAAGTLPPLSDRLPKNPLTLSPVNTIGKYGGRMKWNMWWLGGGTEESQYGHSALRWIDDGLGIAPGMCESWSTNADNTVWTLKFREGLKWSDGQPCTTEDVMYWWEDLVINPDHGDQPPDFGTAGGKLAEFKALDAYTLEISYVEPAPLTAKRLAMWVNGNIGPRWIAPKHYMKQFHPKYNTAVTTFEEHDQKILFRQNPDCPSLDAWICVKFEPSVSITWDRNPYYYAVDTEGNQLPYIDGIDELPVADRQTEMLKMMQGSTDFSQFTYNLTLADIAPLKESEEQGGYEVRFWDSGSGTGMMYFWNYDTKDDKKRELYRNPKFKQAMSFAMDRPTIQKVVYYDTGMITTGSMSPKAIEFNLNEDARNHYKKFRDSYSAYDPEKAKALLDEIGVVDADGDGWRDYPDGSKLEVKVDLAADAGKEATDVLEICQKNWAAIGLNIIINQMPPSEFGPAWRNGTLEFRTAWEVGDGPDHLLYPSWVVPNEAERWAPLCGNMLVVQGTEKEETECEKSPWERTPPRFCKADPQYAGTPIEKLHQLYEQAKIEVDEMKRMQLVWEMNEIHMNEGPFFLGTVCNTPRIVIVSKKLENVPTREQLKLGGFCNPWIIPYPAITNTETYSFK